MAIIKAFNGVRYAKENITDEICPPYDVISPKQKEELKAKSQYNMVKLELSDSQGTKNKYEQASILFKEWLSKGVLLKENKPALYFYEQEFIDHGIKMVRRGFFAALKIENPCGGVVKAHEKTLSAPKEDRLNLLKSVEANLSPIFLLFNDDNNKIVNLCKDISTKKPTSIATDDEKTNHKVWVISDETIVKEVENCLKNKKTFIADGHHRYETSWNYLQYIKDKDSNFSDTKEYGYVLAFLCPMEDEGISIWPTHRVIEEPKNLEENIEKYFNILPKEDFIKLQKERVQPIMIFKGGNYRTLVIKDTELLNKAMQENCEAFRNLGVSILHNILIPKEQVSADKYIYVKDEKEAVELAKKTNKIAIIVPATPVEAIKEIALNDENMPQKSTYFFPKLASGIVIHTLC